MMPGDAPKRSWSSIFRRSARHEVAEEFAFHLGERTREYMATGMSEAAARKAALERIGEIDASERECVELLESERRAERWRDRVVFSWLDFKLGARMLVRYPGITLIGCISLAFAIAVCAGGFQFISQVVNPSLPFPDGDRMVGFENRNLDLAQRVPTTMHDLAFWRENLRSVDRIGGFETYDANLVLADGTAHPTDGARISPSAFEIAGTPAYLGRGLVADDEQPGAPFVAVVGYDLWQRAFGSDRDVVGTTVRIGRTPVTVVGVMPEAFALPVDQDLWTPLTLDASYPPDAAPPIRIFGSLTPDFSLDEAAAELAAISDRMAADFPESHRALRADVMRYPFTILRLPPTEGIAFRLLNLFLIALLILIAGNVALLMFARTASRQSELTVRSALGASRLRIVTQIFVEALLLSGLAAILGIAAASAGLRVGIGAFRTAVGEMEIPFWIMDKLLPSTVIYAVLLGLLGATVAGVIPALKATGKGVGARLRESTAGGGGTRLGGLWTTVIVVQIATTVPLPVIVYAFNEEIREIRANELSIASERLLIANFVVADGPDDDSSAPLADAPAAARGQLVGLKGRLLQEPGVRAVTYAARMPRMSLPFRRIEVDDGALPSTDAAAGRGVSVGMVDPGFFAAMGARIRSGRDFQPADAGTDRRVVLVNESFVNRIMGGQNPVGRRIRYLDSGVAGGPLSNDPASEEDEWYEVIGIVEDLGMSVDVATFSSAGFYHPIDPAAMAQGWIGVRVDGDPSAFVGSLRSIAAEVDPAIGLREIMPLDAVPEQTLRPYFVTLAFWVAATLLTVMLALAAVYAALSFTVSRRTREIGIRVALGARRFQIVLAMFRRPALHVAMGLCLGTFLMFAVALSSGGSLDTESIALLLGSAALIGAICSGAFVVPTRRALSIEPTEAMRGEG